MQTNFNSIADLLTGLDQSLTDPQRALAHTLISSNFVIDPTAARSLGQLDNWLRNQAINDGAFKKSAASGNNIAIFQGVSSAAKTDVAKLLAKRTGVDLKLVDLSKIDSKYTAQTEKNIDALFASVRGTKSILYFDEADALFGKRTEVKDAHDRYANIEANYLLAAMESHQGLSIISVTHKSHIDSGFTRRLRFVVSFDAS